jgi:hypothetical protein
VLAPTGVCSRTAYRNNNADPTNSPTKNPFRIKIPKTPGGFPEPNPKLSAITATDAWASVVANEGGQSLEYARPSLLMRRWPSLLPRWTRCSA